LILYGTGVVRREELVSLKISDIGSARMLVIAGAKSKGGAHALCAGGRAIAESPQIVPNQ
jgi:hypothetical protein